MNRQRQDAQNAENVFDQPCMIPFDQKKQLLDGSTATELDNLVERCAERRRHPERIGFESADFERPGRPVTTAI
jgi:hypothetical protein